MLISITKRNVLLMLLFFAGMILQYSLYINWDIVHLLYAAERMLDGGRYAEHFFTPNPPMILYLYALPVWIAKLAQIKVYALFPLYLCVLSFIAVCFAVSLIRQLDVDHKLKSLFVFWFALSCFILPCYQLGQRDLLFFQFAVPWVLLMLARMQQRAVSNRLMLCVSAAMGLVTCIRPQFVVIYFLLEFFYFFHSRSLHFFRRENGCVVLVGIVYFLMIYNLHHEYIEVMLLLLWQHYYDATLFSFSNHLSYPFLFGACIPFVLMLFFRAMWTESEKRFVDSFLVIFVGFLFSYLNQRTLFLYHLMPLIFLSLFFLWMMFLYVDRLLLWTKAIDQLMLASFTFFVLGALYYYQLKFYQFTLFEACLIAAVTIMQGLVLSGVEFKIKSILSKVSALMLALTVSGIFCLGNIICFFQFGFDYKKHIFVPMVNRIEKQIGNHSVMMLSIGGDRLFPAIVYTHAHLGQSFDCLWFLNRVLRAVDRTEHVPEFFVRLVAHDLHAFSPDFVLVESNSLYILGQKMRNDVLSPLLQMDLFKQAWQDYAYVDTWRFPLKDGGTYEFKVYKHL